MSADNGIYILKTKDQYRVAHLQAIENIYYSAIDGAHDKTVPTRVVELWGESKYTKDFNKAMAIAQNWINNLPICEYGISIISYNKTWKHILEDAIEYAKKELIHIKQNNIEKLWDMEALQKIADGYYLAKWNESRKNIIHKNVNKT